MITLRSRRYGTAPRVMLSIRIKQDGRDTAVALGIGIGLNHWQQIRHSLRQARNADRYGAAVILSDALAARLWRLLVMLSHRQQQGLLRPADVAQSVRTLFRGSQDGDPSSAPAKPTFTQFVARYIDDCAAGRRLKCKSTQPVRPSTLDSYRGFLTQFRAYEAARRRPVEWDDITFGLYDDLKRYFLGRGNSPNTIARYMRIMKTMLFAARDEHYTTCDDFTSRKWSADFQPVDSVYVSEQRLRQMAQLDLRSADTLRQRARRYCRDAAERDRLLLRLDSPRFRQQLDRSRDVFLLGCLTGQRVSDYLRLTADSVVTLGRDQPFLHIIQRKTGQSVYVPYTAPVRRLLTKYHGRVPPLSSQQLNRYIKVVGLLLGWTESAGLTVCQGLARRPSPKRFCDALMSHTARRSFATNAYKRGVPLAAIMAVTGHAGEDMLRRYLKLDRQERALMAAAAFRHTATTTAPPVAPPVPLSIPASPAAVP